MRSRLLLSIFPLTVIATACSAPAQPTVSGGDGASIVLAEASSPGSLDPLAGYAPYGAAKIFDGLVERQPSTTLRPVLAAAMPEPGPNGRSWRVELRDGVRFSDGTTFDADDVVVTYRALLDPRFGSPLRDDYSMLSRVDKVDAHTVEFTLNRAYAHFADKLVLGISPSQKLAGVTSIALSSVGEHPVGTGPYELAEWHRGKSLTLSANEKYFQGQPTIKKITILLGLDDDARWAKVRKGEVDAAALPVNRTHDVQPPKDYRLLDQRSAEFRAISLPAISRVTGGTAMRRALNYAVDRETIVDSVLGGKGSVASTPITDATLEFVEPEARFVHDDQLAERLLNGAGWKPGADGVRERRGVRATFQLYYPLGDSLAKLMVQRFVEDVARIGVSVEPVAATDLAARARDSAVLFGAGNPFDPDLSLFSLLHSTSKGVVASNWSGYSDPEVDSALDYGQREIDPGQRAVAYRELQRAYLRDPAMVVLARIDHSYLLRESWTGYQAVTDAADTDFTWGPWWNLQTWYRR